MFNRFDRMRRRFDGEVIASLVVIVLLIAGLIGYFVWYNAHDCHQTGHILYWSSYTSCAKAGKNSPTICRTINHPVYETKCRR